MSKPDVASQASELLAVALAHSNERRSVIGYGVGLKYDRRRGFGRKPVPCATFLVRQKRKKVSRREKVWKRVRVGGNSWPTDVISAGYELTEQRNQSCRIRYAHGTSHRFGYPGSCGFYLREVESPSRCYLVTAGHVLLRKGARSVRRGDRGVIAGTLAREVVARDSYFLGPVGFLDLGLIRVSESRAQEAPPVLRNLQRIVPIAELYDQWYYRGDETYHWHPARGADPQPARMGAVIADTYTIRVRDRGERSYSPHLLYSKALHGASFQGGDSGSPVTTADGSGLMAIHFLGKTPSKATAGYALCAETIVSVCQENLGAELELA